MDFLVEEKITARVKAMVGDPKSCQFVFSQFAFTEAVRPRESTFRFSEVKTFLTADSENLANELFGRCVRMELRPHLPAA